MGLGKRIQQWYEERQSRNRRAHAILQEWLGVEGAIDELAFLAVKRAKDIEMYYKILKNPNAPEALHEIASLRVRLAECQNGRVLHLIDQENRKWWRNKSESGG